VANNARQVPPHNDQTLGTYSTGHLKQTIFCKQLVDSSLLKRQVLV